jgi:hypothetical protein
MLGGTFLLVCLGGMFAGLTIAYMSLGGFTPFILESSALN